MDKSVINLAGTLGHVGSHVHVASNWKRWTFLGQGVIDSRCQAGLGIYDRVWTNSWSRTSDPGACIPKCQQLEILGSWGSCWEDWRYSHCTYVYIYIDIYAYTYVCSYMYINICKHKYLPLMDLHSAQPRCCVCLCEYPVSLPVFICVAGHVDLDICSVHMCVCVCAPTTRAQPCCWLDLWACRCSGLTCARLPDLVTPNK